MNDETLSRLNSLLLRAAVIWLGFCAIAFINGAFRELVLKAGFGIVEPAANQVSCVTGVFLWSVFALLCWPYLRIKSWPQAFCTALGWFLATAIFETFVVDLGLTWPQILDTYNLARGQYWGLVLLWIALIPIVIFSVLRFRHYINSWGATDFEQIEIIKGEEFLRDPHIASTQAVTIESTAENIWPWLVQMGQGRGGFYSYSWLENLVGCNIKNAVQILPQYQGLKQGDSITLHAKAPPLIVTVLDIDRTLAFEGWIFQLQNIGANKTRLIARVYTETKPEMGRLYDFIMKSFLFDLAHFIMSRKQLLTIKRLCEAR